MARFIFIIFLLVFTITSIISCKNNSKDNSIDDSVKKDTVYSERIIQDTVFVHDTICKGINAPDIKHVSFILQPPMFDSVETRKLLDESIWTGTINNFRGDQKVELETRSDLEYLPYLLLVCNKHDQPIIDRKGDVFISLCTEAIDDQRLFDLGKQIIDKMNKRIVRPYQTFEYPDSFTKGGMFTYRNFMWFSPTAIDTLRVRALAHNDRDALEKLEKYYQEKDDDMGIAVYYKAMLGYKGNADLAERFYRVLEPNFSKVPQLRSAVREVLLQAAICDHNERAQELCDSLGFSLCDYRLPTPPQSPQ